MKYSGTGMLDYMNHLKNKLILYGSPTWSIGIDSFI